MKQQTFSIEGIHCTSCKALIELGVSELDGVKKVKVDLATKQLSVEYDELIVDTEQLKKTVSEAGSYTLVVSS